MQRPQHNAAPQTLLPKCCSCCPHTAPQRLFMLSPCPTVPAAEGQNLWGSILQAPTECPVPSPATASLWNGALLPEHPRHTHTLPLQHPTGSTTAISHVPRSSVYTHKCRGIVCKAALIPAAGTGPNIDEPNLLPLAVQDAGLCCCRQTIPGLWQPAPIFSVLLEQGQL